MAIGEPDEPYEPDGAPAPRLPLPVWTWMPDPLGKLETVFELSVAWEMFAIVVAEPNAMNRMPAPLEVVVDVELVIVLFEIVPLKSKMSMPWFDGSLSASDRPLECPLAHRGSQRGSKSHRFAGLFDPCPAHTKSLLTGDFSPVRHPLMGQSTTE